MTNWRSFSSQSDDFEVQKEETNADKTELTDLNSFKPEKQVKEVKQSEESLRGEMQDIRAKLMEGGNRRSLLSVNFEEEGFEIQPKVEQQGGLIIM